MCEACQERMFASAADVEKHPADSKRTASPDGSDDVLER
jgi:hypothetical protein